MKLLISFLMIFQMICTNVEFYGKSYIVYDSLNQYVVEGRNIDYLQSVASISKIMTAIVVIENSRLDKKITVDETINKAYGSCVYIHIKDRITIQDLLYGLMLRSGNDCALMLAKSVGGSVERFVEMMNEKARDIGMKQTHFSNPSGLDEEDEGNLSTVKEMAILYRYCCQNPLFNQIVKTKEYKRLAPNKPPISDVSDSRHSRKPRPCRGILLLRPEQMSRRMLHRGRCRSAGNPR